MDPLSGIQIVGLITMVIILLALACAFDYAYKICWCTTLPCRGMYWCCGKMKYNDDEDGVCCGCDGHCIV